MGVSILIGSFVGGLGSTHMPESGINVVYGILAIIAAVMMLIHKKGLDDIPLEQIKFNKWLAASLALIVGIGAGIVGAGGAFLLVPIMLTVLKIPTRMTIASSLAITLISSIGAIAGKKVNTKVLQVILALLIVAVAVKIWIDILVSTN